VRERHACGERARLRADPQLCIVEVQPKEAEFGDNSGARGLRYPFEATKAYLTGTTPESDHDENAEVRM
jgi:hypothetical protein